MWLRIFCLLMAAFSIGYTLVTGEDTLLLAVIFILFAIDTTLSEFVQWCKSND